MENLRFLDFLRIYTTYLSSISLGKKYQGKLLLSLAQEELSKLTKTAHGEEKDILQDWQGDIKEQENFMEKSVKGELESESYPFEDMLKKQQTFQCYEIPKTSFSDIAGLDDVKEEVKLKAIFPQQYPELYKLFGKKRGGGILLYGLPGTGKTMIAEAIAHETKAKFFPIKCSDLGSKYFGETEKKICRLFDEARAQDNAVIFFDEIEAYMSKRREGAMSRIVPEFLAQMQGVGQSSNKNKILIIAATNKPWEIDSAFLRPGRFDERIYVPLPDRSSRKTILINKLKDVPCTKDIDLESILDFTEGYNGADVDYLCEKAKAVAINEIVLGDRIEQTLTMQDFIESRKQIKSSVRLEDVEKLKEWAKNGTR